jgi:UDP-3-O-[3-hydroxymyristoyl] glucosamine N-acyltransferase
MKDENIIHETNVMIEPVRIGMRVRIGPYNVIGCDGMQVERTGTGRLNFLPHYGSVIIGNDVIIGSFNNIDKGRKPGDNTVIEDGTFLGKHVHIGHNAHIGRDCLILNHVIITGSVTVKDRVRINNGAILFNGITVGNGATIGAGSIVTEDVKPNSIVHGHNPARFAGYVGQKK